ncbi:hypothetical protein Q8F55_007902 [Vanrija albida]|uniref:Uncharacterized protein n=1 Tax=Vanrija albida TaxID=181172 RepID=A0ABR3PUT4_9TREE
MDWMVVVAMIVHLHAPAEERLYPVTPTKEDARRLVRDEFPVIVLHNTKGDMSPGQTVTSSHVHALAVVTVLHELMHTVTHRLCTAALTPTSTAQLAGRRRAERRLGEALELQLLGGLIGMTWGKEPWELSTALAMTASVPSGASLQKVLLSQAWCDGFLAALDSSSLPRVSSSEHTPWKDPKGAICSRINQDLTDDDIITALAPLSPEEEEMLAEARTRCTVIVG